MLFKPQHKIKIIWSSNFAYAIGLITSDGYLSKNKRHIELKSADKENIINFKKALRLRNRIGKITKTKSGNPHYYLFCGDVIFYKFLNKIGLESRKSKTIKQILVPKEFFNDFLRGLFDGDGTFYTFRDKRWPNAVGYQISFASASREFLEWLQHQLSKLYKTRGFIKIGKGVFNLCFVKRDTRTLFSAMYKKQNILFLRRKYDKIIQAFKHDTHARVKAELAHW